MKHKYKNLIKDTAIFALGSIGSKFITFFLVPLYTNCLTQEQYGIADLVFTVAQLLMPVISLTIYDAVIRFGLEYKDHPESVALNGIIIWGCGSLVSLCLLPLSSLYTSIAPWKWYLFLYVVMDSLLAIELNYLKAKGKNMVYTVICITQTLCVALMNILCLVILKIGIPGYLLSTVSAISLAALLAAIFGGVLKDLRVARFDRELLRRMVKYSAPLIFNNLAWWIIQSSNRIMIEAMLGGAVLGLFTVAVRIPSLVNVAVSVFQQAWGISSVLEMDSTNDSEFYADVFKMYTLLVCVACLGLNTIIKPFMHLYVAKEYFEAWRYVPLLVGSAAFSAIAAYFGSLYGALKKSMNNMISTILSAAVNLLVNLLLINYIGIWGAIIGTVLAYAFLAIYRMVDVKRFVELPIDVGGLLINFLLILTHAVAISLDFHVILSSVVILAVFVAVNYKTLRAMAAKLLSSRKH